jgi:hypothetical protein
MIYDYLAAMQDQINIYIVCVSTWPHFKPMLSLQPCHLSEQFILVQLRVSIRMNDWLWNVKFLNTQCIGGSVDQHVIRAHAYCETEFWQGNTLGNTHFWHWDGRIIFILGKWVIWMWTGSGACPIVGLGSCNVKYFGSITGQLVQEICLYLQICAHFATSTLFSFPSPLTLKTRSSYSYMQIMV